jgi:lipase chaperone LimK
MTSGLESDFVSTAEAASGEQAISTAHPKALADHLRQMIAVLEQERQALAALDLEAISLAYTEKLVLCDAIDGPPEADTPATVKAAGVNDLDDECLALVAAARRMNQVNLTVRNLMAANVKTRLDALTGRTATYELDRAANT